MLHPKHTKNKNRIRIKKISSLTQVTWYPFYRSGAGAVGSACASWSHTRRVDPLRNRSARTLFWQLGVREDAASLNLDLFCAAIFLGTFPLETKDSGFTEEKKKNLQEAPLGVSYGGWCYAFCEQYGSLWQLYLDSCEPADDRIS